MILLKSLFNKSIFTNIRFYVLLFSFILSIVETVIVLITSQAGLVTINLLQTFAFTALFFLYLALLAGPLTKIFLRLPFRPQYMKARRALGVSAFYFMVLHVYFALFPYLGGPLALFDYSLSYRIAIFCSTIAFIIIFLMAITSFDFVIAKMTFPKWKRLHQLVYLAAFLILVHATMIGSHFAVLGSFVPILVYLATLFLIAIHIVGLYKKNQLTKMRNTPSDTSSISKTPPILGK